jgi:predicted RNA binding protein YcfA (HicA-like mRNA interferase family)
MRLPVISGKEMIKILYKDFGFRPIRQRGDHVTITNDKAFATVPLHSELDTGTLKSVLNDCGISREEFLNAYGRCH